MRAVAAVLVVIGSLSFGGCASDGPSTDEVQDQFRRGASGQGQLTPGEDDGADTPAHPGEGHPRNGM